MQDAPTAVLTLRVPHLLLLAMLIDILVPYGSLLPDNFPVFYDILYQLCFLSADIFQDSLPYHILYIQDINWTSLSKFHLQTIVELEFQDSQKLFFVLSACLVVPHQLLK